MKGVAATPNLPMSSLPFITRKVNSRTNVSSLDFTDSGVASPSPKRRVGRLREDPQGESTSGIAGSKP